MALQVIRIDPTACDGFGQCAELLPELITLDEWGYPIVSDDGVPGSLTLEAQRAVNLCPRLALRLERQRAPRITGSKR